MIALLMQTTRHMTGNLLIFIRLLFQKRVKYWQRLILKLENLSSQWCYLMTEQDTCERYILICRHHVKGNEDDVERLIQKHNGKLCLALTNELSNLYDYYDSIDERTNFVETDNIEDNLEWQHLTEFLKGENLI